MEKLSKRPCRALTHAWLLSLATLLLAACATPQLRPASEPTPVLLVSIDGFHPDYLEFEEAVTLRRLAAAGALAEWMTPAYPTLTFPNHYTVVTGLHPDRHGIIHNSMSDPDLGRFGLHLRDAVGDGRWWGGEPIWLTAQRQGLRAATLFWPGSEADIQGERPDEWLPYDGRKSHEDRVDRVLGWMAQPQAQRPHFMTLYFEAVDSMGHAHGPGTPQVRAAIAAVDAALARLLDGLEALGQRGMVNMLITSDHGMTWLDTDNPIVLDDLLPADAIDWVHFGQVAGVNPRAGHEAAVEQALLRPHPRMSCHRRGELPERWHYGSHPRVPAITCQAVPPHSILPRRAVNQPNRRPNRGGHGYDNALPEMRAFFLAHGPAFQAGVRLPPVEAVDVYPLMTRLLGLRAAEHQGNPAAFDAALLPR
ncbi:MAG: ectonucleotide pyrophosphatase/phosphodiesterase [Aquimonas sp.]|nr:ectonucleotide pyrophosphatase/phosphodiesterase [Aquimonas sp.]